MLSPEVRRQQEIAATSNMFNEDLGITYTEIFNIYAQSPFGQHQATQPLRYKKFHYQREAMLKDIGDSVHPLLHSQDLAKNVIEPMLKNQVMEGKAEELSPEDIVALRVAAPLHDSGECTSDLLIPQCGRVVGDVQFDMKTTEDEDTESIIRELIYEKLYPFIPENILERVEEIILIKDPSDFATNFFRSGEDLDYYLSGIMAAKTVLKHSNEYKEHYKNGTLRRDQSPKTFRLLQLGRFATAVPNAWRFGLEDRSNQYPFMEKVLQETRPIIKKCNETILSYVV